MWVYPEATVKKLLPGEDPILVGVQPVEVYLSCLALISMQWRQEGDIQDMVVMSTPPPLRQIVKITGRTGLRMEIGINIFNITLCIDYSKKTTK